MRPSRLALRALFAAAFAIEFRGAWSGHDILSRAPRSRSSRGRPFDGDGSTFQLHYTQTVIGEFKQPPPRRHREICRHRIGAGSGGLFERPSSTSPAWTHHPHPTLPRSPRAARTSTSRWSSRPSPSRSISRGIHDLRLSADTLARIFQGDITFWDAFRDPVRESQT